MLPYWLLFSLFALGSLLGVPRSLAQGMTVRPGDLHSVRQPGPGTPVFFMMAMLLICLMVGLRYRVGADWQTYDLIFSRSDLSTFWSSVYQGDWAYQVINASVAAAGGALWQVNLICALIFTWGLTNLARTQPEPWLAVLIAIPYLVIVVAMGYTRQGAALGILMAGLAAVQRGAGLFRFAVYVALAALFHRTAVIVLPLMAGVYPRSRASSFLLILALSVSLYVLFLQEAIVTFRTNYLEARYSSQGAAIRVAQLVLAAVIFFTGRKLLTFGDVERRVWRNFSLAAFAVTVILFYSPSSTAVDRASLYLLPLQLAVLSRIPQLISQPAIGRLAAIGYAASVLFVWLNFATHAQYWLPYQNILFIDAPR